MSGPLRLLPGGAGTLPTVPRPRRRPKWAAPDPLDEVAERLADVCAAAVHPYEIAAVLESDGLSDEQITQRYGRRDLFAVAEELYARVPRGYPALPEPNDPWRVAGWRCLLRGVVFALPGLGYVLAGRLLTGPAHSSGMSALAAAALVGWAWNQALAHRAYLCLGQGGGRAAARRLLLGAPAGAALACCAALALSGTAAVVAFVAGQSGYLAAATALLVLGRERDLLIALAPTAVGAAVLPALHAAAWVGSAVLLGTVGLAVLAAARQLVRVWRTGPAGGAEPPSVVRSVPYGLFGLAAGALTLLAVFGDRLSRGAGAAAHGSAAVALTLSMGPAEWLLYRYRSRALAALRASETGREFRIRAGRVLAGCLAGYLAVLAALVVAAALVWPGAAPRDMWTVSGLGALGAVLWIALLLQAFGVAWSSALICAAAAATELALTVGGFAAPGIVRAVVCGGTALVLAALAHPLLGRATAHR
ncbi:hypothetical protein ABZ746_14085 [Streptomyces sp. NPDC020096]